MIGELTHEQIEQLLGSECICRIGCHAEGTTYVVPVTYAYDGRSFYCHSAEGMKTRMMRRNPEVCVEVDRMEDMTNWQSVIAHARFEEMHGAEAMAALAFLAQRLAPRMISASADPVHGAHAQAQKGMVPVVFRLDILHRTGRYEKR